MVNYRNSKTTLLKLLLLFCCGLFITAADNENQIRVSSPEVYNDVVGNVSDKGIGVIVVYMQSSGDAIAGFEIELFDVARQRTIEKKISDHDGVLRFAVPSGSYRIYLRKSDEQKGSTSARIAEIRIEQ